MLPLRPAVLAATFVALAAGCAENPPASPLGAALNGTLTGPPVAKVENVRDTYFGTPVDDPYRWMENAQDAAFQKWMKAQADYTASVLARIPGRKDLRERIDELSEAGTIVYNVTAAGGRYFYQKQAPGDDNFKLYVRDGLKGKERLIADPTALSTKKEPWALNWYAPSRDGSHVVYGVSAGGSEAAILKVADASSGKTLGEGIDRCDLGSISWLPDNRSFLYSRLQKLPPNAPPTDKYAKSRIYRHVVGSNENGDGDEAVFGYGVSPRVPVDANEFSFVVWSPASKWVLGVVEKFVKNEITIYAAPLDKLKGIDTPWRKVVDEKDDVTGFDVHDDNIYLLTHHKASRFKVVRTSLRKPDFGSAIVIVPASDALITGLGSAQDALYVQQVDGGLARLQRVPFGKGLKARPVKLPYDGAFGEFVTNPDMPGALAKMTSWTEPQLWYAYDPASDTFTDTGLRPRSPVDYSAITSEEVKVRSHDGTLVPLSIIHRKDLKKDGKNPALVNAYGAYGIRQDPGFSPVLLAWLERGGIFAVAHVRGGGEYGEDWHKAGQKLTKPNTWKDLIACGRYLVDSGWTSPKHLGAEGGSAGGITVGRALTEKPELFAAILDDVGLSDAVRAEFTPNGPPNIPEFGTVTKADGFKGLYEMSAYHQVRDGVPYPAVLLTTGINDPRVESWQAAKMAARLQAASTGGKPILLRVDYESGHGIGSTKSQTNDLQADQWSFLLWQFGDPDFQP